MAKDNGMARCSVIRTNRHRVAIVFYPTIESSPWLKGWVLFMLWHVHLATIRDIRRGRRGRRRLIALVAIRLCTNKTQAGLDGQIRCTCRVGGRRECGTKLGEEEGGGVHQHDCICCFEGEIPQWRVACLRGGGGPM